MIRGTVQPFKFTLPCQNTELDWVKIYFEQSNNPKMPIIKVKEDCGPRNEDNSLDGTNTLWVSLTSYDTAQFSDRYKAKAYLLAKPIDGVTFGMGEYLIKVYPMPDDIIVEDPTVPSTNIGDWIVFDGSTIL